MLSVRFSISSVLILLVTLGVSFSVVSATDEQCEPYRKAPSASTLKCSEIQCNATCMAKYKFPKGESTLTMNCNANKWTITNANYRNLKEFPACQPVCSPVCANKGKCIAPNRCQCTQDFQGATCRERACRTPPAMTRNAKRTCKPSQCIVTCMPGFKFKNLATTMNLQCRNGNWITVTRNLALTSHCEPHCSAKCLNGGKCVGPNKCQCTENFAGAQCQHSREKCSLKKTGFNGSFNCLGSETELSCSLKCPDGIKFDRQPASIYKCKYTEGTFKPAPLPKCVYGDGVTVVETRTQDEGQPERITNQGSSCTTSCMNGGTCFFNMCQCPQDFAGPRCQYSTDRCAPQKIGFNGAISCAGTGTSMSCTLSCPPGIQFDSPPASAYTCTFERGVFTPAKIPKCVYGEGVQVVQRTSGNPETSRRISPSMSSPGFQSFGGDPFAPPTCSPSCMNGGSCVFHNMCQCSRDFRGMHCQYSVDRCSIKNTNFNGGFRCSGSASEMSCTLNCPNGIDFEFPPATAYVCKFETGKFTPERIPQCVYGEGVEVIRRISSK